MKRHLKLALVLGVILAAALPIAATAEELPVSKPDLVGLDPSRLDRITDAIEADIASGEIPGAVAMVLRHGKIAYLEARGMADSENNAPMRDDTIFRLYSMSKPITSVGVMMLFEEGRFFLSDPVSKYIPELGGLSVIVEQEGWAGGPALNLPDTDPADRAPTPTTLADVTTEPARREMTIQDLLRHSSGLTYGFFGNSEVDSLYQQVGILVTDKDLEQMVTKLGKLPLKHHPGEEWEYSVSTDVLGRLIEVVSGQSFDAYLKERIFDPLGMPDTGFYVPNEKLERFAQLYDIKEDGLKPTPQFYSRNFVNEPTFHSGGGGMVSTARDYATFCQMMLNGGTFNGTRILSRKTIELMTSDHYTGLENPMREGGYTFGLGFAVAENVGLAGIPTSIGEHNWGGMAGTGFWIDPSEDLIGVYMIQVMPPRTQEFSKEFKVLAYQSVAD